MSYFPPACMMSKAQIPLTNSGTFILRQMMDTVRGRKNPSTVVWKTWRTVSGWIQCAGVWENSLEHQLQGLAGCVRPISKPLCVDEEGASHWRQPSHACASYGAMGNCLSTTAPCGAGHNSAHPASQMMAFAQRPLVKHCAAW